jgi:hypothetical protein
MIYKIVSITGIDGSVSKHIIIDNGDDTFLSFPADESNPEYVAFLAATAKPAKAKATVEPEASKAE